jgi:hypothetical protein
VALKFTQPLTEMSNFNKKLVITIVFLGDEVLPARKADVTAVTEESCLEMWDPRRLTTLWVSTSCYRESFTYFLLWACIQVIAFNVFIYIFIYLYSWFDNAVSAQPI